MLKKQPILFILLLAVFTMAFSGCTEQPKNNQVNNDNQQKEKQEKGDYNKNSNQYDPDQKQANENEWQGEIIKEEGDRKRYRNEKFGFEFKFLDKNDSIEVDSSKNGVFLGGPIPKEQLKYYADKETTTPYVYIDIYEYSSINGVSEYENLKEYLKVGWNNYQTPAELLSIKKVTNKNNLIFFKVNTRVSGLKRDGGYYNPLEYYLKYNKIKNKDYIHIRCPKKEVCDEIIESFKFIK